MMQARPSSSSSSFSSSKYWQKSITRTKDGERIFPPHRIRCMLSNRSAMSQTHVPARDERDTNRCLARSVVDTLAEEPALEAVTIDRTHQKVSVATLGQTDVAKLSERLTT